MTQRPPKKSDMLEVRIPYETKRAFLEACREVGRTASEVVREFVDSYLRRVARRRSSNHPWSIAMSLNSPARRRAALAAGAGAGALGLLAVVGLTPSTAQSDLQGAFAMIDANGDGRITAAEFADRHAVTVGAAELAVTFGGCEGSESCSVEEWWVLGSPPRRGVRFSNPKGSSDREERVIKVMRRIMDGVVESEEQGFVEDGVELIAELRQDEFGETDRDGDGAIDLAEYETHYEELVAERFSNFDRNGDGRLTAEEYFPGAMDIARFFTVFGEPGPKWRGDFRRLDQDADGGLTLEEFSVGS